MAAPTSKTKRASAELIARWVRMFELLGWEVEDPPAGAGDRRPHTALVRGNGEPLPVVILDAETLDEIEPAQDPKGGVLFVGRNCPLVDAEWERECQFGLNEWEGACAIGWLQLVEWSSAAGPLANPTFAMAHYRGGAFDLFPFEGPPGLILNDTDEAEDRIRVAPRDKVESLWLQAAEAGR